MRNLLFFLLLISSNSVFSQNVVLPRNKETNMIEYTELVKVDSMISQNDLYLKAKEWMARTFNSAKEVIQMDDKDAGIIIGKGNFLEGKACRINFTLKIQVKNGRFKYWFSDFSHDCNPLSQYNGGRLENDKPDCGYFMMAKREWKQMIPDVTEANIGLMILDLKSSLSNTSIGNLKDNW